MKIVLNIVWTLKIQDSQKRLWVHYVDGETIHNNEEILIEEVNFYRKLYTTENVDSSSIQPICLTLMILQSWM